MKFQLEKHLPYAGLTLLVLALFYGIYFAKKHCTLIVLSIQKA